MQNLSRGSRSIQLAAAILFLIPSLTPAQTSNVQQRITAAIGEANLTTLRGNVHPLARSKFDRGGSPPSLPMQRMLLVLKRSAEQEAALEQLLQEQQNESSPNYRNWLTPQQFGQQYGPADRDIQTITSWLESHGFAVNQVSNGRTIIEFTGTAGQVREAFHTEIHKYTINEEDHWANSSDPQIPTALTPVVAGVVTLHNFPRKPMHRVVGIFSREKGTARSQLVRPAPPGDGLYTVDATCGLEGGPCYTLGPYDFAAIYNVLPLWNATSPIDGTGQTIAIVGQSDIYPQDVSDFRNAFGLPAANLNIIHNGADPGKLATEGDEAESDLDVEWAGAVAKGASIDFVVSATTNTTLGVDLSAQYAVDNNLAPILSESYGICEFFLGTTGNQFYNQLWQQAAAQGITVLVATGDSGSAVCDRNAGTQGGAEFGLSVSGFASTPYNVAVGGTDFNDLLDPTTYWNSSNNSTTLASAKTYIPEMTWNDSCTNQEVITFLGLATAEGTCNNSNALNDGFVNAIGASGGKSSCTVSDGRNEPSCSGGYPKPPWQIGLGVPNDEGRDVPDVSLFAADGLNANFYVICETDIYGGCSDGVSFVGIGGTSASTPAFAGIMAMVNQKTQSSQGNANYVLYQLAAQSGASCNSTNGAGTNCVFYDVTNGTIAMPCPAGSPNCNVSTTGDQVGLLFADNAPAYNAVTGYDLATGLGSVNAANLVNQWATFALSLKPSSTSLTLNAGSAVNVTHGQVVSLTANVEAMAPATGTPTGNFSLIANTGPDAQEGVQGFQLINGSVTATTNALPGGSYTVTAHYPGDGTFASSNSSPGVNVTVSPEPSTTTVQAFTLTQNGISTPFITGPFGAGIVYLRTDVAGQSGAGAATGPVNLADTFGGVTTNFAGDPYQLNNGGNTMAPLPGGFYVFPSPGTHSIVANYSGDVSFNPSTSSALSYTILKAQTSTSTSVTSCAPGQGPCNVLLGSQVTIFASVSDSSSPVAPPPTGTVTFFSNGTQVGSPIVLDSSISPPLASLSTDQLPLGKNSITEQYSGDTNYVGSISPATSVNVFISTTTGLTTSSTTIQSGQSVTFTVQVMPTQTGGPALTGNVQFLSNGSDIGSPVSLSGGQAQFTTTALPVGLDEITAAYSGDSNYLSSSAVAPVTVNSAPDFSLSTNPGTITISSPGATGTTAITITTQNGFTGMVTFACTGLPAESSCNAPPVNGSGTTTLSILTTAPSMTVPLGGPNNIGGQALASLLFVIACCLCVLAVLIRRKEQRWITAFALVALASVVAMSACGGGGGGGTGPTNPGTPTGSANVTVTATGTMNGMTRTHTVLVTVNVL